jgi:hypothetical protein
MSGLIEFVVPSRVEGLLVVRNQVVLGNPAEQQSPGSGVAPAARLTRQQCTVAFLRPVLDGY